ncbi:MAG TPA: hypothetical protein PLR48_04590 [Bacillota bacterium]|nr:hypothetical protein [Bacillota bacterium]
MKGKVTVDYTGRLPEDLLSTISELIEGVEIEKVDPLVLKHDYSVDSLLNLVLGLISLSDLEVKRVEMERDVPEIYEIVTVPFSSVAADSD